MRNFFKFFIRLSSFFRKEIVEVVRQPRLILTLILGPFLILLLFGVGFRNEPRNVTTLFVAKTDSPLTQQIEEEAPSISPQLIYAGITSDDVEARRLLSTGNVEMVVVVPDNAAELIRNDQQAEFFIYHNEIDPAQAGYIEFLGQTYVEEVNRRVLSSIAQEGQSEASDIQSDVASARQNAAAMRAALQAGDVASARAYQQEMNASVSSLSLAVGASAGLLSGIEQNSSDGNNPSASNMQTILTLLNDIQQRPSSASNLNSEGSDYSAEIRELEQTEADLAELETQLAEFQSISPNILVRPFTVKTMTVSERTYTPMDFFTPAVIVLLLQHVAVTIASLSIVRERRSGTMELFRVSPITALETLLGKYFSYILFVVIIGAVLGVLLAFGLNAPMFGNWVDFALVALALIFSSLGLGFLISLLADTESQAVQFSMIALLLSVFFSGFMLDLRYLWEPIRVVSWMLPATHAITLLQNIMLRGNPILQLSIGALLLIGFALFVISLLLMRRQMARE